MMENRSYDHYFGAYPRGRGFDDHPAGSLGVFEQNYPGGTALNPPGVLLPFHLDSSAGEECTDDLTHDWGPQHLCWNSGKMDSFVSTHMRVPALMISPLSRGGNVVSEVFDHTSQLKLVAERFGVEVPNVSAWRKATVGDLTSAAMSGTYNTSVPAIAAPPRCHRRPCPAAARW